MTPQDKVFTQQLLDNLEKQGFVLVSKSELKEVRDVVGAEVTATQVLRAQNILNKYIG